MNNIEDKIKKFFINKKFLWLLLPIITYIFFLTFFFENSFFNDKLDGGGIIKNFHLFF